MHFLPDVYVTCEVCKGRRYNRETLEVKYKGRSISDVLEMSVDEALDFFQNIPPIKRHMQTLSDVGLGYVRLGQPAPTLSGGEAQRIKLSSELHKRATGNTLYVLDEPTTGLHFEDVRKLLAVLQRLVATGNTVLVIEHNLDVIKTADHVIDLGPDGGDQGGSVVAAGTPEQVAADPGFHTGRFLAEVLERPIPAVRTDRRARPPVVTMLARIPADVSKRLTTLACAAALLAAACSDIPEGEVVPGEGPRFVVTVADAVDNVGLGNAVAVDADGVPFYSYLIFAAEVAEGEIPAQRPIGAPYIQAATTPATETEPAVPGKFGAAVGVGSVTADGIFTRGAAAQVRDAPGGVTVPYGPATVEALIGQTAASMNGTDIALDATGGMHVVWAAGDGIYYAEGGGEGSFSAQHIYDYGFTIPKAGPIGRPSVTTDADGDPGSPTRSTPKGSGSRSRPVQVTGSPRRRWPTSSRATDARSRSRARSASRPTGPPSPTSIRVKEAYPSRPAPTTARGPLRSSPTV